MSATKITFHELETLLQSLFAARDFTQQDCEVLAMRSLGYSYDEIVKRTALSKKQIERIFVRALRELRLSHPRDLIRAVL